MQAVYCKAGATDGTRDCAVSQNYQSCERLMSPICMLSSIITQVLGINLLEVSSWLKKEAI